MFVFKTQNRIVDAEFISDNLRANNTGISAEVKNFRINFFLHMSN